MLCYISAIFFIIIITQHFLVPISNANPSIEDKMLIAFVRNGQKVQISEYSKQKYEAYLGILYFMRNNWQCEKIADEFEEYERTECQKYRKYLDILHEYLYREYVGIPTVKPKFVFKQYDVFETEIEGPIIYAVNCLAKISRFYFHRGKDYEYKLNDLFLYHFEPKLLNEERLNYEVKLPINEMILQLAIETAYNYKTNKSLDEIIRQKCPKNFEEKLGEMFKRAEERGKKVNHQRANEINDDIHFILNYSKFDDSFKWIDNYLFSEFFKRQKTNVATVFNQNVESHLCNLYSLRKNFRQCDSNCEFKTFCNKGRKNSLIIYEYLFRLYAEANSPSESRQFSPVKPIFIRTSIYDSPLSLFSVVQSMITATTTSCKTAQYGGYTPILKGIDLVNEVELNYDANKEGENWLSKCMIKNTGRKDQKEGKDNLNESTTCIKTIREEFEEKMKKMCESKSKTIEKQVYD